MFSFGISLIFRCAPEFELTFSDLKNRENLENNPA
jgi:hypothetical protein